MDDMERIEAVVRERLKASPGADPIALFAQVLAEEADSLAAEAHRRGQMGLASKLDGRSAAMDKLAASRPRRRG